MQKKKKKTTLTHTTARLIHYIIELQYFFSLRAYYIFTYKPIIPI